MFHNRYRNGSFLVSHMSNEQFPPEQARAYFSQMLPKLRHWGE